MAKPRPLVVLDLTALDTPGRTKGHGRYIRDLALGLARLDPKHLAGIELVGLTHLDARGRFRTTHDLASFTGSPGLEPTARDHYAWAYKRRLVLWRALRALDADVVHLADSTGVPLFMGLTHALRITTCHDLTPARYPEQSYELVDGGRAVGAFIERRRYTSPDLLVAISDATRDDAIRFCGVPPERVVRVHNGIDLARWSRVPPEGDRAVVARWGLADAPYVVFVGDVRWHKNVDGVMRAMGELAREGRPMKLAWASSLTPERAAELARIAATFGARERVVALGFVPDADLPSLLRESVALLLPSRNEGFGMPLAEAMASGAAAITSRAPALVEVAGDAALFVDAEEPSELARAIVRLAEDRALRAELGRRGRERAKLFSNEAQAIAMAAIYRRVAGVARLAQS